MLPGRENAARQVLRHPAHGAQRRRAPSVRVLSGAAAGGRGGRRAVPLFAADARTGIPGRPGRSPGFHHPLRLRPGLGREGERGFLFQLRLLPCGMALRRLGPRPDPDGQESDIPFASEIKSKHAQHVILEDNRAYPFTVNASFRNACLFRYKVDRNDSVETYFSKGEVFTATPHNGIRLWISNANSVKFTIIADSKSYDLDIGAAGQILVEDIKWIKDSDGRYKLVVFELD